jgi:hypothetical protein
MMASKKFTTVRVTWEDSCASGTWRKLEDALEHCQPATCTSVGYLLRDDERDVLLAQSEDSMGSVTDFISIPRSAVREMKVLRG